MKHRSIISILTASLTFAVAASSASADVLLAETRTSSRIYGGASYLVRFQDGDSGYYNFVTTEPNTPIVIFFNAEAMCGGNTGNWTEVNIIVNPAGAAGDYVVPPTNGDNAFVSGNTTYSNVLWDAGEGWISAAIVAPMVVANAGVHTVRVQVNNAHCGISRFDDMSLVVMQ